MKRSLVFALLAFGLMASNAHGRMNFSEYVKRNTSVLKKSAKPVEIIAFKEKEPLRQMPEDPAARGLASEATPGGAPPVKAAFPVQGGGVPASGAVGGGLTTPPPSVTPNTDPGGMDEPESAGPAR